MKDEFNAQLHVNDDTWKPYSPIKTTSLTFLA